MKRFTIRLPEDLDAELKERARRAGSSKSAFVRHALRDFIDSRASQRPEAPPYPAVGVQSTLAERVDAELEGFGES